MHRHPLHCKHPLIEHLVRWLIVAKWDHRVGAWSHLGTVAVLTDWAGRCCICVNKAVMVGAVYLRPSPTPAGRCCEPPRAQARAGSRCDPYRSGWAVAGVVAEDPPDLLVVAVRAAQTGKEPADYWTR